VLEVHLRWNGREQLLAVFPLLKGAAYRWHMGNRRAACLNPEPAITMWEVLSDRLVQQYRTQLRIYEVHHALYHLTQTGSVEEYVDEFPELTNRLPTRDSDNLRYKFQLGLKDKNAADEILRNGTIDLQ
jgi:hypothetical protein